MKRSLFFAFVGASILLSSNLATASGTRSCSLSASALGAAMQRLVDNDNAKNLEGLLSGYTDDAVLLPPKGDVIAGKTQGVSHLMWSPESSRQ